MMGDKSLFLTYKAYNGGNVAYESNLKGNIIGKVLRWFSLFSSTDNTRRTVPVETSDALFVQDNALIVQDGLGYDWSYIAQDEPTEFALMAYTSNSLGSDTEVQSCSKNYVKTYEKLQKQFDEQRQTLSKANLEIVAYQLGLESVEAQILNEKVNAVSVNGVNTGGQITISTVKGNGVTTVKASAGNQTNKNACPQEANGDTGLKKSVDARQSEEKNVSTQQYIMFLLWSSISSSYKSSDETYKNDTADDAAGETPVQKPASENEQTLKNVLDKMMDQKKEDKEKSDAVRKEFEAHEQTNIFQGIY
ncbi:hypothetical protein Tco_0487105 [Tanacetum coccineum]